MIGSTYSLTEQQQQQQHTTRHYTNSKHAYILILRHLKLLILCSPVQAHRAEQIQKVEVVNLPLLRRMKYVKR